MNKYYFYITTILITYILMGCGGDKSKDNGEQSTATKQSVRKTIQTFTFERGNDGWGGQGKIKVTQSKGNAHTGDNCLKIQGSALANAWGFAGCSRINLQPNTQYEFQAWVKVESITGDAPLFILQWVKPEGGLTQLASSSYNLNQKNEWQELKAQFTTPSAPVAMYLSLAKRPHGKAVQAVIYLDDITVVQLQ